MLQLMPELWASQWKEGGVAGKRACHGSSVCYPKGSLWDCEPVAIAHLWLLFTQFICEWTPWEILPGLYVYAKLLPYKTKWKFKFCIPTYNLFVTCKKKTYLLLSGPLWEIFWFHPYSDHDLYNTCLVLLWSGLACT